MSDDSRVKRGYPINLTHSRRGDPGFDWDLKYGEEGEEQFKDLMTALGNGEIEVKRKSWIDEYFYIETHDDPGCRGVYRPSGISISTARAWVFVIADTGITVSFPTDLIRLMLTDPSTKDRAINEGSCPTRGKLIDFLVTMHRYKQRMLAAPDAEVSCPPSRCRVCRGHLKAITQTTIDQLEYQTMLCPKCLELRAGVRNELR